MIDLSRREFLKTVCVAGLGAAVAGPEAWCLPEVLKSASSVQQVHVVFMTHLDLGFTALAKDVLRRYFEHFIPGSIDLARRMRERGGTERFVWTTGSWLIYEYLEKATREQRRAMERAISEGDIHWNAAPFSAHTELMDANLARVALSVSRTLDRRFGTRTVAAKMSDVPGHTRSIVPLLAEAGVKLLHVGVNRASRRPSVPTAFRWRADEQSSVVGLYSTGYGGTHVLPGFDHALSIVHSGDNHGPQTEKQVIEAFHELGKRFPGARIQAGGLDSFVEALPDQIVNDLPVVTSEIGDTWIHGAGSDPGTVARLREFERLHTTWLGRDLTASERVAVDLAARSAMLVCEHTWGLDVKTHLADWDKYTRDAFNAARTGEKYRLMEASWQEKRARIDTAIEALSGGRLGDEAREAMEKLRPKPLSLDGFEKVDNPGEPVVAGQFHIAFSSATGAVVSLRDSAGREWASPESPLGLATYQSFSQAFYDAYYRYYDPNKKATGRWAPKDFGKPGLDKAGAVDQLAQARLIGLWKKGGRSGTTRFVLRLDFPDVKAPSYGQPSRVEILYEIAHESSLIDTELRWFEKPACRLPEALWFSFQPVFQSGPRCTVDKTGRLVDVRDVVPNGNRHIHAVDDTGAVLRDPTHTFQLRTFDAPLVAIGRRMLVEMDDRLPDPGGGLHVNLYNNVWGTNFRMWYGEDARFRFRMEFQNSRG